VTVATHSLTSIDQNGWAVLTH